MWFDANSPAFNASYLLLLATLVGVSLLFFYHKREPMFGMTSLYITLGVFMYMEDVIASIMRLDIGWGLKTNPGSAVLFPANLLIVLLLYKRKTADELKKLCLVLISVNLLVALVSLTLSVFVGQKSSGPNNLLLEQIFSAKTSLGVVLSSVLLAIDIIVVLFVYDKLAMSRTWIQLTVPLLASLWVDALGYSLIRWSVFGDEVGPLLESHLACKTVAGLFYSTLLRIYLGLFEQNDYPTTPNVKGMFKKFLYYFFDNKLYPEILKEINTDPDTGLPVNLQETLANHIRAAWKSGGPIITIYMMKIINYKDFKDRLEVEHYNALRAALNQQDGQAFLHNPQTGVFAIVFHRHVDANWVGDLLDESFHTRDERGLPGYIRTWPTDSRRLDFVDSFDYFVPYEMDIKSASDVIHDVTRQLAGEESEELRRVASRESQRTVPVGGDPDPSRSAARGRRPTLVRGRRSGTKASLAMLATIEQEEQESTRVNAPIVVKYKGYVEVIQDGVAYLNLEGDEGQRIDIEWEAAKLDRDGIGEGEPFLLTTTETDDGMKFAFQRDRPGRLSKETTSGLQRLLDHYRAAGALDE